MVAALESPQPVLLREETSSNGNHVANDQYHHDDETMMMLRRDHDETPTGEGANSGHDHTTPSSSSRNNKKRPSEDGSNNPYHHHSATKQQTLFVIENDENTENVMMTEVQPQPMQQQQQQRITKRSKMGGTPQKFRRSSAGRYENGGAGSSSAMLRTPQQDHQRGNRNNQLQLSERPPSSQKEPFAATATSLVQRMVDRGSTEAATKKYFTPLRVKPKIKKEEVQATDTGYASVAKLSAWLADDPTSTKKMRHVRRGRNVIAKSRQFEKDLEGVVIEEAKISRGTVTGKKDWLKKAFREEDGDVNQFGLRAVAQPAKRYAQSEIGASTTSLFRSGHHHHNNKARDNDDARSEIVFDDAASSLSVSDKKDWLKNAFGSGGGGGNKGTPIKFRGVSASKAQSDVLDLRGANREEATARAKNRFRERSARKLIARESIGSVSMATPTPTPTKKKQPQTGAGIATHAQPQQVNSHPSSRPRQHEVEQRTGPPPPSSPSPVMSARRDYVVDEDKSSVNFRAARALLVKRGKTNGNDIHIINKITRQRMKFEQQSSS